MKKCKKRILIEMKKVFILGVALLTSIFTSCTIPFLNIENANITDISEEMTFQKIRQNGFMGGSILYNPDNPSSGQLAKGVTVAIRLGYVEKEEKNIDEFVYTNNEDKARYGYITIDSINKNEISFSYFSFDKEGLCKTKSIYSLRRGEFIDINSDGLNDLKYDYPKRKRPSFENALWLTFLSNQETLNTSMFAVLPTQYERSIYPSGIMGINPYGKFIISKYENDDSFVRSMVYGIQKGDYIFDRKTGNYFVANKNFATKETRCIEELELSDTNNFGIDNFYYSEEDFDSIITPLKLLEALPTEIIGDIVNADMNNSIKKLNGILREKKLIENIYKINNEIIEDELYEILRNTDNLSDYELVSLNRMFLNERYKEVSPFFDTGSTEITEVLPLYSCFLGDEKNNFENNSRVLTYSDYQEKKNKIDKDFSEYSKLKVITENGEGLVKNFFEKTSKNRIDIENFNSTLNIQLGVKGHITITFSNLDINLSTAVYIKTENLIDLSKTYSKTMLPGGKKIVLLEDSEIPISCGNAITFYISCPIEIDVPLAVNGNAIFSTEIFSGFTGLYGAGIKMGAEYGTRWVKWFKIWGKWISRLDVYFDGYCEPFLINESVWYSGPQTNEFLETNILTDKIGASISLNPYISIGPKIRWTCFSSTVNVKAGIDNSINIAAKRTEKTNNMEFDGIAKIDLTLGVGCVAAIKLNLPFGIGEKKLEVSSNLIEPIRYNLATWEIF